MQIHELNNFSGTLGAGSYLAIDNGTDTGRISSQGLLASTEARIDAANDQITDLKSAITEAQAILATKIGFVNEVPHTMFDTGAVYANTSWLATTRRWFVNQIFSAGTHINNVYFGFDAKSTNQNRICNFEIWEKSGDNLTKVKTVSVDVSQDTSVAQIKYATATINYTAMGDCMLCIRAEGSPSSALYTVDERGAGAFLVSSDVTAGTSALLFSSLETFSINVFPEMKINYEINAKVNIAFIGNGMDYEEIQDALADIDDDSETNPYTLLVTPKGVPYKPFSMLRSSFSDTYPWNNISPRHISIIGIDRAHCVIQSDSGDYAYPCAELMTNGIIKNLKFVMTNNEQTATATQGGYCLHIDCRTLNDVGYDMTIEDCDFENASAPCLGIGVHANCNLKIKRCNLKTTLSPSYNPHAGYRNLYDFGCIFAHTSTLSNAQNQKIAFEDCVGTCEADSKSLWITSAGDYDPATASFEYTLLRNVFWNNSANAHGYVIGNNLTANPMNFGNNNA